MRGGILSGGCGTGEILLWSPLHRIHLSPFVQHEVHVRMFGPAVIDGVVDGPRMRVLFEEGRADVRCQLQALIRRTLLLDSRVLCDQYLHESTQ